MFCTLCRSHSKIELEFDNAFIYRCGFCEHSFTILK